MLQECMTIIVAGGWMLVVQGVVLDDLGSLWDQWTHFGSGLEGFGWTWGAIVFTLDAIG